MTRRRLPWVGVGCFLLGLAIGWLDAQASGGYLVFYIALPLCLLGSLIAWGGALLTRGKTTGRLKIALGLMALVKIAFAFMIIQMLVVDWYLDPVHGAEVEVQVTYEGVHPEVELSCHRRLGTSTRTTAKGAPETFGLPPDDRVIKLVWKWGDGFGNRKKGQTVDLSSEIPRWGGAWLVDLRIKEDHTIQTSIIRR